MQSAVPTASLDRSGPTPVASGGRLDVEKLLDLCAQPCSLPDNSECDDNYHCTVDTCNTATEFCEFTTLAECCGDGICTTAEAAAIDPLDQQHCPGDCCYSDSECPSDNYACTNDVCVAGYCEYQAIAECCGDEICTTLENDSGSCPGDCKCCC